MRQEGRETVNSGDEPMLKEIYRNEVRGLRPHDELTVLLVDPEPDRRIQVKSMLARVNTVKMSGVRNTHHFLSDALSENNIDVILFDEDTGLDNIFDSVREVRSHPSGEDIGFVVISSTLDPHLVEKGSQVGILGYLKKPFGIGELEKSLGQSLGEVDEETKITLASMKDVSFFSAFSDRELLRLLNICHTRTLEAETPIFREGDPGETMYVVLSGQISIRKRFQDEERELTVINPGETFGEMAILDNDPRSADAVAAWDTTVFEINNETIQEDDGLLALKLSRQIAIMLAHKIRSFNYR